MEQPPSSRRWQVSTGHLHSVWFDPPSQLNKAEKPPSWVVFLLGGAEPLPISEAWGHIADESDPSSKLEEGIEQTNLRKLPLCQVIVRNPLGQLWLVGKSILQGARNGR